MEGLQGDPLAERAPPFPDLCVPAASREAAQASGRYLCLHTAPSSSKASQQRAGGRPRRKTSKVHSLAGARGLVDHAAAGVKIFRGVRMRSWGKWVSEIRQPKKRSRIWLGSYSTPEAAAQAYDIALYYLRGPLAAVNFPALIPSEDPPADLSPRDVQKAAISAGLAADKLHVLGGSDVNSTTLFNLQMNVSASKAPSSTDSTQVHENTQRCGASLLQQDDHVHHGYQMWDKEILQPPLRYVFGFNLNEAAAAEGSHEEGEARNDFLQ